MAKDRMLCFLCGKKIGLLRALFDQQYCSPEHRKEARLASAQAYRDEEEYEPWGVTRSRDKKNIQRRGAPSAGQTASVFAFLAVGGLLVAALLLPGPSGGGGRPHDVGLDPSLTRGFFARTGDALAEIVRSSAPVTL